MIAKFSELIRQLRLSATYPFAEKLAKRLEYLNECHLEDEGEMIALHSLSAFLEFLFLSPGLSYPDVTLTPEGEVCARWEDNEGVALILFFVRSGSSVRYVVMQKDVGNRKGGAVVSEVSEAIGKDVISRFKMQTIADVK